MNLFIRYTILFSSLLLVVVANPLDKKTDGVTTIDQLLPSTRELFSCTLWYFFEGDPADLLAQTKKPPCSISATFPLELSGNWSIDPGCDPLKQPNTCDYHKGAQGCYRHAFSSTGPGAQACYDSSGQWISDPWLGAGTVDKETPIGDFVQQAEHALVDVAPYLNCCKTKFSPQPFTCNLYYEKRPPGQCQP